MRTDLTADMESTLDALSGGESLADHPLVDSLAADLDDAGAVAAALTLNVEPFSLDAIANTMWTNDLAPEVLGQIESHGPTLETYRGMAKGLASGEDRVEGTLMVIVLKHTNVSAASVDDPLRWVSPVLAADTLLAHQ